MIRSEYIKTKEGQHYLFYKRMSSAFSFEFFVDQFETKKIARRNSKVNSIEFQKVLLGNLLSQNRRFFKGNIALQIIFYNNDSFIPPIGSLLKHYIDLLFNPFPEVETKRKGLLIYDDKQIKAISASVHRVAKNEQKKIYIIAKPFRDFVANIEFARNLERELEHEVQGDHHHFDNMDLQEMSLEIKDLKNIIDGNKDDPFNQYNKTILSGKNLILNKEKFKVQTKVTYSTYLSLLQKQNSEGLDYRYKSIINVIDLSSRIILLKNDYVIDLGDFTILKYATKILKKQIKNKIQTWFDQVIEYYPQKTYFTLKVLYEKPLEIEHDLDNLILSTLPIFDEISELKFGNTLKNKYAVESYQILTSEENKDNGRLYLRLDPLYNLNLFYAGFQ